MVHGHDCVVALRALGEDTRVRIVGLLIDEALDVGEISKRLGVSQYNVSKHLRILREAGLLEVEKNGRTRLYALPETIRGRAGGGQRPRPRLLQLPVPGARRTSARSPPHAPTDAVRPPRRARRDYRTTALPSTSAAASGHEDRKRRLS